MFDLITGTATHIPRHPRGPMLVSTGAQLAILGLVVLLPVVLATHVLPQPPTMMAFVVAAPPPPFSLPLSDRASVGPNYGSVKAHEYRKKRTVVLSISKGKSRALSEEAIVKVC